METKANYLMIGGFVLGVLVLAFISVFWMSNFAGGGKNYYIVFESTVAGLTTGSSVGFNGIRVGEVQSFALDPQDARKVQVLISVRDDTPVRENSHATIQSMGLTGGSGVQITPGTPEFALPGCYRREPHSRHSSRSWLGPRRVRSGLGGAEQCQCVHFQAERSPRPE